MTMYLQASLPSGGKKKACHSMKNPNQSASSLEGKNKTKTNKKTLILIWVEVIHTRYLR